MPGGMPSPKPLLLVAVAAALALLGLPVAAGAATLHAPPALQLPRLDDGPEEAEAAGDEEAEAETGEEEGDLEAEGCEEADEECWEEEGEDEVCILTSAEASVETDGHSGRVRLAVRYSSFRPAAVAIDLRLRGPRGAADLGTAHARFGRGGVFHDVFAPGRHRLAKVLAAHQFTVVLHPVNTPRYCRYVIEDRLGPRARGGHRRRS